MSGLVLAVEIGGTKLQAALGDRDGTLVARRRGRAPAEGGAEAILEWFAQEVPGLIEEAGRSVSRIGVGFGGPVESATGKVLTSHQVEGWSGFDLKPWFEQRLGLETFVFNDSNAAGWAEYCLGAGQGTRHFMYSNIGSGIGGALVIDGVLQDGQGRGASEVGHTLVPDWEAGTPGEARKLELLCSGWAIERRQRAAGDPLAETPLAALCGGKAANITCPMLAEAAAQGDARALDEIERVGRIIGLALANAITLFHPERIALGGGVSLMGDVLLTPVRHWANEYVFGPFRDRFEIVPCALGESVVLVGALLLAQRAS
ncbi:MAG: ROK family protein [Nitrospiraceae bacterium]|nr:ROK family protein [Nitrospiraceae bacterium]